MSKQDLLDELVSFMDENGRQTSDVRWVGSADGEYAGSWDEFVASIDDEYLDERDYLANDLAIVGADWWITCGYTDDDIGFGFVFHGIPRRKLHPRSMIHTTTRPVRKQHSLSVAEIHKEHERVSSMNEKEKAAWAAPGVSRLFGIDHVVQLSSFPELKAEVAKNTEIEWKRGLVFLHPDNEQDAHAFGLGIQLVPGTGVRVFYGYDAPAPRLDAAPHVEDWAAYVLNWKEDLSKRALLMKLALEDPRIRSLVKNTSAPFAQKTLPFLDTGDFCGPITVSTIALATKHEKDVDRLRRIAAHSTYERSWGHNWDPLTIYSFLVAMAKSGLTNWDLVSLAQVEIKKLLTAPNDGVIHSALFEAEKNLAKASEISKKIAESIDVARLPTPSRIVDHLSQ